MSGSIKAIDASSVHRITSGQVIVDLQSAVKELLENSLDAGATIVDVKFKDFGTVAFEVSDNGSGIEASDYESIALKSHTSKLATYDGLNQVTSFGFRGEALSSLCQLANVTITTATKQKAPVADVLTFDKRGKLLQTTKVARACGTTVQVASLFDGVPVRRKEFDKNHRKHFAQAQNLVQAYGLISTGVRISLSNQQSNKAQNMFKTDGKSIRENYAILFKASSALTLLDFDVSFDVDAEKRVLKTIGIDEMQTKVRVKGLVSKPTQGNGRTSTDRQFFYINGRPFDTKNIARAFNEVYKNYVPSHYPSVVADFILPPDTYDVNVSPDKRSIFLHSERNLVEGLKAALENLFQPSRSTYNADSGDLTRTGRTQNSKERQRNGSIVANVDPVSSSRHKSSSTQNQQSAGDEDDAEDAGAESEDEDEDGTQAKQPMQKTRSRSLASANIDDDDMPLFRQDTPMVLDADTSGRNEDQPSPSAQADVSRLSSPQIGSQAAVSDIENGARENGSAAPEDLISRANGFPKNTRPKSAMQWTLDTSGASWNLQPGSNRGPAKKKARTATSGESKQLAIDHFRTFTSASGPIARAASIQPEDTEEDEGSPAAPEDGRHYADERSQPDDTDSPLQRDEMEEDDIGTISAGPAEAIRAATASPAEEEEAEESTILTDRRKSTESEFAASLSVDMSRIKARCSRRMARPGPEASEADPSSPSDRETNKELEGAGIDHETEEAEKTLSRLVSKADFASMEVVGQFNVAFIIARRRHNADVKGKGKATDRMHDDLMIIDQHASDEKYNFERLQQVTKIDSQKLIRPRELNLTASDELLAIEHEEVLRFNGFEIEVDEDAQAGQRIKLVAMPVSKATKKTEFTMQDLEELLFLLREHTGSGMIRPSKTRKLFAMLACRSSVMVGKVLNNNQMTSIVRHMGTMDQPWNCPHGRNTMRWLKSLDKPAEIDSRFRIQPHRYRDLATSMEDSSSVGQSQSQSQ